MILLDAVSEVAKDVNVPTSLYISIIGIVLLPFIGWLLKRQFASAIKEIENKANQADVTRLEKDIGTKASQAEIDRLGKDIDKLESKIEENSKSRERAIAEMYEKINNNKETMLNHMEKNNNLMHEKVNTINLRILDEIKDMSIELEKFKKNVN